MSDDDRTQAPSRRRRQQAREAGQVAQSPELTAAAGLLVAAVLLSVLGDDLAGGLIELLQSPFRDSSGGSILGLAMDDPRAVAASCRAAIMRVLLPLVGLLGGAALALVAAHQVQVGGLWVSGLLAPDPARLLSAGANLADPVTAAGRGLWAILKIAVVLGTAAWALWSELTAFNRLATLEPSALATACGGLTVRLLRDLAVALAVLGVADFGLRWRRLEARLRMTAEEGRADLREGDGDPQLRARRRRLADTWRRDPADLLPGAALLVVSPPGLTVLLAGGPPPERPIVVRRVARGAEAALLLYAARGVGLPIVDSPTLAAHLARDSARLGPLPPDLASQLAAQWPSPGA